MCSVHHSPFRTSVHVFFLIRIACIDMVAHTFPSNANKINLFIFPYRFPTSEHFLCCYFNLQHKYLSLYTFIKALTVIYSCWYFTAAHGLTNQAHTKPTFHRALNFFPIFFRFFFIPMANVNWSLWFQRFYFDQKEIGLTVFESICLIIKSGSYFWTTQKCRMVYRNSV